MVTEHFARWIGVARVSVGPATCGVRRGEAWITLEKAADPGHVVGLVLAADCPIFGQSLIGILDSADWSDCYRASGSGRN